MKTPLAAVVALGSFTLRLFLTAPSAQAVDLVEPPGAPILTPPESASPRVNGPRVFGVRPGSPFLYTVPATGQRPLEYAAEGLPAGLKLDAATGRITGIIPEAGEHSVTLRVKNALGAAEKPFRIVVDDRIALTPPMGWNSWNCWGGAVSQDKVLSSARAMAGQGRRDHGWSYVNIDDGWQGVRGGEFNAIQPNPKFPDLRALGESIHALGLRFGIYSTPWQGTYEGHVGSSSDHEDGSYDWVKAGDHNEFYRIGKDEKNRGEKKRANWNFGRFSFVQNDAAQWAAWGVDYLKYDWSPNDAAHISPMSQALRTSGRDIFYSLSNTAPYGLAPDLVRLANAWRTTGDIQDTWQSMSRIGFAQDRWAPHNGPGHWNDPDMLVVGRLGWGPNPRPTRLTPDEQYTHISLWCLLSAPLLLGCDIVQLDDFTRGLLTNDEVLEIDQDALGKQATQISHESDKIIYAKALEDGSTAVGLFNLGAAETAIAVHWGPGGELSRPASTRLMVRDLWRQHDLGDFSGAFETKVPAHGVVLLRLSPSKS